MTANGRRKPSSPLELLAGDLDKQAKTLTDYLRASSLPEPSFERDAPTSVLPLDAPEEVQDAREQLMDHALQIFQLVAGPSEYLETVQTNYHYMEVLRWMSRFRIFELVPLEGSVSYADLAAKASVSELRLRSLARMAMTNHLFAEPEPGFLAHSATSAALVADNQLADRRNWMGRIIAPSIASMVAAHERWPDSTAPNQTAFSAAFDTDLVMYEYIAQQPELYRLFGRVMEGLAASPKSGLQHLVNGFAWDSLGQATVVDVGGNIGHSSAAVAKSFPALDFIVQDTAHVVEEGRKAVKERDSAAVAGRIRFQEYDFFTEQPVKGAGAYLFRQIFHNWDCALDSHVLIMEFVLPEPGTVPSVNERVLRSRDVGMMQLFNSLERDLADWKALLAAVDPRLKIRAVNTPFGSFFSVIDVVLEG